MGLGWLGVVQLFKMLNVFSDFLSHFSLLPLSLSLWRLWLTLPMLSAWVGCSSRNGGGGAEQWWVDRLIPNVICNLVSGWWLKGVQRPSAEGEGRRKEAAWGRNRAGARQASTQLNPRSASIWWLCPRNGSELIFFNYVGWSFLWIRTIGTLLIRTISFLTYILILCHLWISSTSNSVHKHNSSPHHTW